MPVIIEGVVIFIIILFFITQIIIPLFLEQPLYPFFKKTHEQSIQKIADAQEQVIEAKLKIQEATLVKKAKKLTSCIEEIDEEIISPEDSEDDTKFE